ncbi:toxin-antitoxin system YwqK family antitoxin [Fusobacterium animalis]|uniref:toxin-antitoxin system YwqK family antitoxin n=1 Tax=Fusobacterium animalis TaxID=76859 RepID=UPI0030CA794D
MFCLSIFASPADFFKSYPNGSIEIDIKWENDELYYNSYFYNANHNKINAKQNWDDFKTNGLLDDIYDILNKNYSNKNMTVSVLLNISPKNKPTMTSKYYNSNNILLKEIIEDKFIVKQKTYDEYGNLISEAEKNEKKNTYHIKTYDKNLKSYAEMEVLFNKNEINFKGNKEDLGYYVSDSYAIESHYTFKKLNQKNLSKILSNLRYYNYEDVVSGYEKIYDNNKPFEYTEKTYKNGKLVDTKKYTNTPSTNTINFKNNLNDINTKTKSSTNNLSVSNNYNITNNIDKESNNLGTSTPLKNEENNSSYIILIFITSILVLIFIITIYKLFFKKNKEKKLKYFEYIDLGDRKAVRYKGNLLNSSINYKFLCNRKNILLFIVYKNGSPTSIKFSVSNYYIDIDIKKLTNNLEAKINCYIGTHKIYIANGKFKFLDWMYGNIEPKSEIDSFVETEKEVFYYLESFSFLENIFSPILLAETLNFEEFLNFIILDGTIEEYYKNGKEMFYKSYFDNDNKQEKKNTLMDIVKIILTDIMQYLELIKILQKMN